MGRGIAPRPSWDRPPCLGRSWRHRLLGGRVQSWLHRRAELLHLRTHRSRIGNVFEPALAVLRRTLRPAPLPALLTLREVHEPVGHLAHLPILGEVGWDG